jgi:putative protease
VVYLTASRELDARARQLLAKSDPSLRKSLPVDMTASIGPAGILRISGSVERPDGTRVMVSSRPDLPLAPAASRPLTAEMLARQLEKSGGTPFVVQSLAITGDGHWFAPVAEINRIRREFFDAAITDLLASYRPAAADVEKARRRWQEAATRYTDTAVPPGSPAGTGPQRIGVMVSTLAGVREAATAGADRIYFGPDLAVRPSACGTECMTAPPRPVLEEAITLCRDAGIPLFWKFPHITHDRYLAGVLADLPALSACGLAGCMTDNAGTAAAIRATCPGIPLVGAAGLNIFNHAAAIAAGPLFSLVTLSPELSQEEITFLAANLRARNVAVEYALVVQGAGDAMITEDCLPRIRMPCSNDSTATGMSSRFTGIRDESGQVFPVYAGDGCRTRIGNARELCLIEYLPALRDAGVSEILIDARDRPPAYVHAVCRCYRKGADLCRSKAPNARDTLPKSLVRDIERISPGGITTGHLLRGLRE